MSVKKGFYLMGLLLIFPVSSYVFAQDANPSQFFYIVKNVFPEIEDVAVFISQESLEENKALMDRAAAQNKIKATIYLIETSTDVGDKIRELKDNSVLVIFSSDVLMKKSTQLYILKNCKDKRISVFTSSRDYSELGALMGLIKNEDKKVDLVLNLKQNEHLKTKFTGEYVEKVGIQEVIQ